MQLSVDLATTPDLRAFRDELSAWLAQNLTDDFRRCGLEDPSGSSGENFERRREWQRRLHAGGWAGVHWPRDHGGRGASLAEYAIFLGACAEAGAPEPVNQIGLNMVGPTLIAHGTREQRELLPGILSADDIWCQLFSEPDAGSDLGGIRTRARPVGAADDGQGGWIVTGQKVWTTLGPMAARGLLLARTGVGEAGFAGLSSFLIDMRAPGVTVRGLRQMGGETHFAEVFLNEVRVPSTDIVGREGDGWAVATSTLVHERTTAILSRHPSTSAAASMLVALAGRPGMDPVGRDQAIAAWIEAQLLRISGYRGVLAAPPGGAAPAALTQRLQWGLVNRRIFNLGITLQGTDALIEPDPAVPGEREARAWHELFFASRGWTIGGGTSEIQRNMLAEKVLGLPKETRAGTP